MSEVVKRIARNDLGRDFVVGDIHGAYDLVLQGMRSVGFEPERDRLFCCGDLVDRGAGSRRVSKFLLQPYVHAVMGNHDKDFSDLDLDSVRLLSRMNYNGMAWASSLSDDEVLAIQSLLRALPLVIEVETVRGTVGIVHGEVPQGMSWAQFLSLVEAGDEKVIHSSLRGRERVSRGDAAGVPGIGRVFCGHTVNWAGAKQLGNVYMLDTGAVFREVKDVGHLSMVDMVCRTGVLAGPPVDAGAVRVELERGDGLFGEYASPR